MAHMARDQNDGQVLGNLNIGAMLYADPNKTIILAAPPQQDIGSYHYKRLSNTNVHFIFHCLFPLIFGF